MEKEGGGASSLLMQKDFIPGQWSIADRPHFAATLRKLDQYRPASTFHRKAAVS